MRRGFRVGLCLLFCALFAASAPAQESRKPRIETLHAEARGPDVFLRFRLDGALNPELATKIEAGLETAIRYDIRLYRHNAHWLWDDRIDSRRYRAEVGRRLVSRENLLVFRVGEDVPHTNLYLEMRAVFDSGYLFTIIPVDARTPWKESNRFDVRTSP
jgi:hypothetical protein